MITEEEVYVAVCNEILCCIPQYYYNESERPVLHCLPF